MKKSERQPRPHSAALNAILGKTLPVAPEGFVRVVDYLGNDASVVQAARVSYGAGTKTVQQDRDLVRYLLRHSHTTPFEMCELKLHLRVPMDVWRQWIRHRTASVNEYSTRYSVAIDAAARTSPADWRLQATTNRQGSGGAIGREVGEVLSREERAFLKEARGLYERRIAMGVAREQARKDLPLSTYTEAYWKINLHNLLSFLRLRMRDDAQLEIRRYARIIGEEIVSRWCPITWEAFQDYMLNAVSLSARETSIMSAAASGDIRGARRLAKAFGWLDSGGEIATRSRERREAIAKFKAIGLYLEWLEN
jgi:thymidylate synthase (FAD)